MLVIFGGGFRYVNAFANVADCPSGLVTVTETVPVPRGVVRLIVLVLVTVVIALTAWVVPKVTVKPGKKPEPVMVTLVPPASEPEDGLTPTMVGFAAVTAWLPTATRQALLVTPPTVTEKLTTPDVKLAGIKTFACPTPTDSGVIPR
jgi:hypothetical protein